MNSIFFKLAFRNFIKHRTYTLINLLGLSIGFTSFILLALFVRYETNWDNFHTDHERIFRIEEKVHMAEGWEHWDQISGPIAPLLRERYPEVENSVLVREVWGEFLSSTKERTFHDWDGFYVEPHFFEIYTAKFLEGEANNALLEPFSIVLSKTLANKLFPNEKALGKTITSDNKYAYKVTGVMEDLPFNTIIRASYFLPMEVRKKKGQVDLLSTWDWRDGRVYVKLKEGVSPKAFQKKIEFAQDEFVPNREDQLVVVPLKYAHSQKHREDQGASYWVAIILYSAIGMLALLLASINFVNLTTAYSLTRIKEVGVKKVVGSLRYMLIRQFMTESFILVGISLILAFTIAELGLPLFNAIVAVPLSIHYIEDWSFSLFVLGIAFATALLAGLYPSLVISKFSPTRLLREKAMQFKRKRMLNFRSSLVVLQFVLSISFALGTINTFRQIHFFENKNQGFNKHNMLYAYISENEDIKSNDFQQLKAELLQIPGVKNASASYNAPYHGSWGRHVNWEGGPAEEYINVRYNRATPDFIPVMEIEMKHGKNFERKFSNQSNTCIVNEAFLEVPGWTPEEAIGKKVWNNNFEIIGIMKDFHEQTPFNRIKPYLLTLLEDNKLKNDKHLVIRVEDLGDKKMHAGIKRVLDQYFPSTLFEIRPFDSNMGHQTMTIYKGMLKTFGFFSGASILIAIIGLFALVTFNSKRRTKETGIRKVLGAKVSSLFRKMAFEYMFLLSIANIIAVPAAYIFRAIDPSYYKPEYSYMATGVTVLCSFLLTLLIISSHILKTTRTNPVKSLRYE